ncbi:hypothetical protein [Rhodopirellula baltica]
MRFPQSESRLKYFIESLTRFIEAYESRIGAIRRTIRERSKRIETLDSPSSVDSLATYSTEPEWTGPELPSEIKDFIPAKSWEKYFDGLHKLGELASELDSLEGEAGIDALNRTQEIDNERARIVDTTLDVLREYRAGCFSQLDELNRDNSPNIPLGHRQQLLHEFVVQCKAIKRNLEDEFRSTDRRLFEDSEFSRQLKALRETSRALKLIHPPVELVADYFGTHHHSNPVVRRDSIFWLTTEYNGIGDGPPFWLHENLYYWSPWSDDRSAVAVRTAGRNGPATGHQVDNYVSYDFGDWNYMPEIKLNVNENFEQCIKGVRPDIFRAIDGWMDWASGEHPSLHTTFSDHPPRFPKLNYRHADKYSDHPAEQQSKPKVTSPPVTDPATLIAAKEQSKFTFYFLQSLPAAINCPHIDERDLILERCVESLRSAVKVEGISNRCVRFQSQHYGCLVATVANDIDVAIRKMLQKVELFGPTALLGDPPEILQLRDECIRMTNELSQRQVPGQLEVDPGWDWIENRFDPTPASLNRFAGHILNLAESIDRYETELVGKPISLIASEFPTEKLTLFELLERLRRVSDWDSGEGSIAFDSQMIEIEWQGWSVDRREILDWRERLPKMVWRVIETLRAMGIPFNPPASFVGLIFDDVCVFENDFTDDLGRLRLRENPIEDTSKIDSQAIFISLDNADDLIGPPMFENEERITLQSEMRTIAAMIQGVVLNETARQIEGDRVFRIDLTRIRRLNRKSDPDPVKGYYPDSVLKRDPFKMALELEGMTGVTLESGSDPVWLLEQHEKFLQATEELGTSSNFSEYLARRFPRLRVASPGYQFRTDDQLDLDSYDDVFANRTALSNSISEVNSSDIPNSGNHSSGSGSVLPPLNRENGDWVKMSSDYIRDVCRRTTGALKQSRHKGKKNADELSGIDPNGHIWRKDPDDDRITWYLRSSLTKNPRAS